MDPSERLKRRYERERAARKASEQIAEDTTRKLYSANEELRNTLTYLTAILDNMADGLSVIDMDKRVKLVNPAALRDLGLDEHTVIGAGCRDAFGDLLADHVERCEATGTSQRFELTLLGQRVGMAIVSPIHGDEGKTRLLGFVALIRDITEAKEIDRMKTEFISNVSHELRTPLTSILGFTKIIRRKLHKNLMSVLEAASGDKQVAKATRQIAGNLDIIITEGERLAKLINDVLDVAKMEAGKLEWQMASLDPTTLVDRTFAAASSLFEGKPVTLEREVPPDMPAVVGDLDRLIQVLLNLVSNAAKFTDEGSVTCRVHHDVANGMVVYRVTDTGMGIREEDLPVVFEKFKQVGDTLTDKPKGTGLGLPISKQIVEHHGGAIWAESELGVGSTFFFSVPVDRQESAASSVRHVDTAHLVECLERDLRLQSRSEPSRAKTVLVVDDEASIRELLRQELAAADYHVVEASDGLDAIEKAKRLAPDLIILDVMMPTMNGFDAAAVLKNDPKTMAIPIVIHSIVEDRDRGFRIGIDRYLTKPTTTEVLLDEVQGVLSRTSGKRTILLAVEDPSNVEALDLTHIEGHVVIVTANECVARALEVNPDTIIVDAAIPEHQQILRRLKHHQKLERASFVVLAEGRPTQPEPDSTSDKTSPP